MNATLSTIWTVAKNNYREIIRDRLLYGILLIAALVTGASFFAGTISLGQDTRVIQNVGIASIHLFSLFICIFTATTSMSRDFERRTLYLLFPKPISRSSYLLGKYVGILLLLATCLAILGGIFEIGLHFVDSRLLAGGLIDLGFSFLEISFLSAFAVLFASFTAPMNAALYTAALFIIGHSLPTLRDFATRTGTAFTKGVTDFCYYLFPNLEKFDVRTAILYGLHPTAGSVSLAILYWLVYTGLVLVLAVRVINVREV